jgi:hypothetical protein
MGRFGFGNKANICAEFGSSGPLNGLKRDLQEGGSRVPFISK